MEDEQGAPISVLDWLKGLQAKAGQICSRAIWISFAGSRIQLRLIALRLSPEQQEKAERRTKRKASKNQKKLRSSTLYFSGWVLVVTTLSEAQWSDEQIQAARTKRGGILNCFLSGSSNCSSFRPCDARR
jgi:hypothetical protein